MRNSREVNRFLPFYFYPLRPPCQTLPVVVYHSYMMASASGVLYIGVTNHLERRVAEHQSKRTQGFSSRYNTTKLVYFEPFSDIRNAIARERQWKTWRREKKIALIERVNPLWREAKTSTIESIRSKK